jgi:hypothetical protein
VIKAMWRQVVAGIGGALVLAVAPAQADTLCDHIRRYERADFDTEATRDGLTDRWVELHWVGFWMDFDRGFGKACVHSGDAASRDLCAWIVENSSTEFPETLPFSILECYGYRFPRNRQTWHQWQSRIEIRGRRWVTLDVDFSGWETETGAIRLGVYRGDDSPWDDVPPLAPLPRDDQTSPSDVSP